MNPNKRTHPDGNAKQVGDYLQSITGIPTERKSKRSLRPIARLNWTEGTKLYALPVLNVFGKDSDLYKTMGAYRSHIQQVNDEIEKENAHVKEYNREVIKFRKHQEITIERRVKERVWQTTHKAETPEAYNELVLQFNKEEKGPWLRLRNLREQVKPVTEKFFLACLYEYQHQLTRERKYLVLMGRSIFMPPPELQIYPNKLMEAQQDGCKILNVSKNTIRHHRDRLIEVGVFQSYKNHGHKKAVTVAINPQILQLSDNFKGQNPHAVNQSLRENETKKVVHNNVSSRSYIVNNKYRDKGISASAPIMQSPAVSSTGAPKEQDAKKINSPGIAPEELQKKFTGGRKKSPKNATSTALATSIDPPVQFCRDLASNCTKQYTPLHKGTITAEAKLGALHPDAFIELAIQDLFRYAAPIFFMLENVSPGSWMNAYKKWNNEMFTSFTGARLTKYHTAIKWLKLRAFLKEIHAYAKAHPDWQPCYPSLYFDPQRTFKENNSFMYAYQHFKMDRDKLKSKLVRKLEAAKDSRNKTDVQKAREKIRAYFYNECSLGDVHRYAVENLAPQVAQNINQLLLQEMDRIETQANA